MANLELTLNDPELRTEAAEALGALIDNLTLTPDPAEPDGLAADLRGDLARILLLAAGEMPVPAAPGTSRSGQAKPPLACAGAGVLSAVPGARYHLGLLLDRCLHRGVSDAPILLCLHKCRAARSLQQLFLDCYFAR